MCTGLQLTAKDRSRVSGRTMEFSFDIQSKALVVPAGTEFINSLADKSKGARFTSKYGLVGANCLDMPAILDGLNEQGLYVGAFYLAGYASYPELNAENNDRALAPQDYGTWLLSHFASVQEVRENFDKIVMVNSPLEAVGGTCPVHYLVTDRTGVAIVIEPVDKQLILHEAPLGVITNSPTYDWHITNLKNFMNLSPDDVAPIEMNGLGMTQFGHGSGMHGLPGDISPPSRFVRAVAFSQVAEQLDTADETVHQIFHLLNNFDIPVGLSRAGDAAHVGKDYTVWTAVSDVHNLRWFYRTFRDQTIRSISLTAALAAAGNEVKAIPMDADQVIEDVSTQFM